MCKNLKHIGYFVHIYTTIRNVGAYANESLQICPFLAVRAQFDSDHYQNRRLSSHLYSHESVIFFFFRLQPLKTSTARAGQSIILR